MADHISEYLKLGYADDLTLLSPSVNALSKMVGITICEEYAKEYDIVFNYSRKRLVYSLVIGAITV